MVSAHAAAPVIRVENLEKRFGGTPVLRDVSLDVAAGETVVIIGASGSGKTTFLRCLNRLEEPDGGSVMLDGQTVGGTFSDGGRWRPATEARAAQQRSQFGFVFQRFNLFPHLTARQNVAIGPEKVRGLPRAEARVLADAHLAQVQMAEHADKRPAQLSGGQQQRVAIARATVADAKLILADEPTGNLDSKNGEEVMKYLKRLHQEGSTIIMVTHSEEQARQAGRIVQVFDGKLVTENVLQAV